MLHSVMWMATVWILQRHQVSSWGGIVVFCHAAFDPWRVVTHSLQLSNQAWILEYCWHSASEDRPSSSSHCLWAVSVACVCVLTVQRCSSIKHSIVEVMFTTGVTWSSACWTEMWLVVLSVVCVCLKLSLTVLHGCLCDRVFTAEQSSALTKYIWDIIKRSLDGDNTPTD